jgi:hypothetical protein
MPNLQLAPVADPMQRASPCPPHHVPEVFAEPEWLFPEGGDAKKA